MLLQLGNGAMSDAPLLLISGLWEGSRVADAGAPLAGDASSEPSPDAQLLWVMSLMPAAPPPAPSLFGAARRGAALLRGAWDGRRRAARFVEYDPAAPSVAPTEYRGVLRGWARMCACVCCLLPVPVWGGAPAPPVWPVVTWRRAFCVCAVFALGNFLA